MIWTQITDRLDAHQRRLLTLSRNAPLSSDANEDCYEQLAAEVAAILADLETLRSELVKGLTEALRAGLP